MLTIVDSSSALYIFAVVVCMAAVRTPTPWVTILCLVALGISFRAWELGKGSKANFLLGRLIHVLSFGAAIFGLIALTVSTSINVTFLCMAATVTAMLCIGWELW
jgi:hypothetical protein